MSSQPPIERLLSRLDGVIRAGDGKWYARCPAHEDRSPSLSIRSDGDKILIHCFAGCDSSDVLAAVGLEWKDLYPDPWECARYRPNEGARKYALRAMRGFDTLEIERMILAKAASDIQAKRPLSLEDRARIEVARLRLATQERAA